VKFQLSSFKTEGDDRQATGVKKIDFSNSPLALLAEDKPTK